MVSDDKDKIYRDLRIKKQSALENKANPIKPSSKFSTVPRGDKINLYSAICSDCHHEVKINFEPTKTEPFYCDYCFNKHRIHHFNDV